MPRPVSRSTSANPKERSFSAKGANAWSIAAFDASDSTGCTATALPSAGAGANACGSVPVGRSSSANPVSTAGSAARRSSGVGGLSASASAAGSSSVGGAEQVQNRFDIPKKSNAHAATTPATSTILLNGFWSGPPPA